MFGIFGPAGMLCNSCLCNSLYSCISKVSSQSDHRARLFGYLLIFALYFGLGTLIMYTFSNTFMKWFEKWIHCPELGQASCFGASLILRVSFSLLILYFLMLLLMLPKDDFSFAANRACWIFKYLLPLGLTIAFFFVGNDFFMGFSVVSKYGAIVYLIFQDLAFNEYFIRFSNSFLVKARESVCYTVLYWLFGLGMTGLTILFIGLDFGYNFNCGSGKAITIISIIIVVINLLFTVFRTRNDINFISTSLYNAYICYYLYSGISADNDPMCTSLNTKATWVVTEILINILLIIVVFLLMTFSREMPVFHIETPEQGALRPEFFANPELRDTTVNHKVGALRGGNDAQDAMDHLEYRTLKFVWLFLCYIFLTMHFLTIITNYGTVTLYKGETWYLHNAKTGFYVKTINGFLAAVIYLWTLTAPLILRNREFGYKEDPRTATSVTQVSAPIQGRVTQTA